MYPKMFNKLNTPCLLLEKKKMRANIEKMRMHLALIGCELRPHVKTTKSLDIAASMCVDTRSAKICVSTLHEAKYFSDAGYTDIMYAVGIAPDKLGMVAEMIDEGVSISIVLDNVESAKAVADYGRKHGLEFSAFIELDVDGHRSGIDPDDPLLIEVAKILDAEKGVSLAGVMTHAGESYNCKTIGAIREMAEQERAKSVGAAEAIRSHGITCPSVSVGSTPTATFLEKADGLTEMRAGVFVFSGFISSGPRGLRNARDSSIRLGYSDRAPEV